MDLPMHGVTDTHLDPPPPDATAALQAALQDPQMEGLQRAAAEHPAVIDVWAHLADRALDAGDPITAYACARTGYHRGLDAIRRAGWKGQGPVPWSHEPNRGFLLAVHALYRAAIAIDEVEEIDRLRTFLLELDPPDTLGVRSTPPTG